MKIEEYISSLPATIISGQDVEILEKPLREIFNFVSLTKDDVFYHLGCGTGKSLSIAANEFGAKSVGIDNDREKIFQVEKNSRIITRCENIINSDISDATVVLFWFSDEDIIKKMSEK